MSRRTFAAASLAIATGAGLVATAAAPAVAGGTGKAVIHFKGPDGSPVPGITVCPTQHKLPNVGKMEGKCGTSDKHGNATMKKVKPGKWFVTMYASDGTVAGQFPKKIKIAAGKTTHKAYLLAG
jgi:hypothetical protein